MNMNTQDIEIELLPDDELDMVAGGERNLQNPVVGAALEAFCQTGPSAGIAYFMNQIEICA
jgi:hypothetical protein